MAVVKNRVFETSFMVLPKHCNDMYPMIFGGAFFSELDLCAACCVNRALHDSECDTAVTYRFDNGVFYAPAEAGDLIFMRAEITEVRRKAISVKVEAWREKKARPGRDKIAEVSFVFVSKKNDKFYPHGLEL